MGLTGTYNISIILHAPLIHHTQTSIRIITANEQVSDVRANEGCVVTADQ